MQASRSASTPSVTDRKSTRLNSSHQKISYAVFCLKKEVQPRNIRETFEYMSKGHAYQSHIIIVGKDADDIDEEDFQVFFFFIKNGDPRDSPLFPSPPPSP